MTLSLDFAFEGFRIIREKPKLILFWGFVLLVGNGVIGTLIFIPLGGAPMEALGHLTGTSDPSLAETLFYQVLVAYAAIWPLFIVMQAMLNCATYRASFGREDGRFGYLRFGKDEIRQIIVSVLFTLLSFVVHLLCLFIASLIATVVMSMEKSAMIPGVICGLIFGESIFVSTMIRLSLFSVQSFDQKRINLFGSWALTKGQGWPLLGGYLVAIVMVIFVFLLCAGIFGAIAILANGGDMMSLTPIFSPDMTSLRAYLQPLTISGTVVFNGIILPLIIAITTGAPASAYKLLATRRLYTRA